MNKLKNKSDVVERYWPDYLRMCMLSLDGKYREFDRHPTIDGFWLWYVTDGPMGVKHRNLYYTKQDVEYL
jgi:hypothetical protein